EHESLHRDDETGTSEGGQLLGSHTSLARRGRVEGVRVEQPEKRAVGYLLCCVARACRPIGDEAPSLVDQLVDDSSLPCIEPVERQPRRAGFGDGPFQLGTARGEHLRVDDPGAYGRSPAYTGQALDLVDVDPPALSHYPV